jgi:hypothetical protein
MPAYGVFSTSLGLIFCTIAVFCCALALSPSAACASATLEALLYMVTIPCKAFHSKWEFLNGTVNRSG